MTPTEKKALAEIRDYLKDCWLSAQNELREMETAHPEFKAIYDKNDYAYTNYVLRKGFCFGISCTNDKLYLILK